MSKENVCRSDRPPAVVVFSGVPIMEWPRRRAGTPCHLPAQANTVYVSAEGKYEGPARYGSAAIQHLCPGGFLESRLLSTPPRTQINSAKSFAPSASIPNQPRSDIFPSSPFTTGSSPKRKLGGLPRECEHHPQTEKTSTRLVQSSSNSPITDLTDNQSLSYNAGEYRHRQAEGCRRRIPAAPMIRPRRLPGLEAARLGALLLRLPWIRLSRFG